MTRFLGDVPGGPARLAELLAEPSRWPIVAAGAYDALSARLVEEAGFPAVYMTGFGTSAGLLGRPDAGLLTMTEMVDNARRIAGAVTIPLIADADTGYGNPATSFEPPRHTRPPALQPSTWRTRWHRRSVGMSQVRRLSRPLTWSPRSRRPSPRAPTTASS